MTQKTTEKKYETIAIHGKTYYPVASRLQMLHDNNFERIEITTEVLFTEPVVVIKATVTTPMGIFTGISSANPAKSIEKANPFEVAETSAVGRALAFAGYGAIESIASADEMLKANIKPTPPPYKESGLVHEPTEDFVDDGSADALTCIRCGEPAEEKKGLTKVGNKPYHAIFCTSGDKSHTSWMKII